MRRHLFVWKSLISTFNAIKMDSIFPFIFFFVKYPTLFPLSRRWHHTSRRPKLFRNTNLSFVGVKSIWIQYSTNCKKGEPMPYGQLWIYHSCFSLCSRRKWICDRDTCALFPIIICVCNTWKCVRCVSPLLIMYSCSFSVFLLSLKSKHKFARPGNRRHWITGDSIIIVVVYCYIPPIDTH